MDLIYLLMSPANYKAAMSVGQWAPASMASEGFIHASPADQLTRVANKHYREHPELMVVTLATDRIRSEVRWEPATGGLYPHIYGPLNMDAVDSVQQVSRQPDGSYSIDLVDPAAD